MKKRQLMTHLLPLSLALSCAYANAEQPAAQEQNAPVKDQIMTIWSSPITVTTDVIAGEKLQKSNKTNVVEALNTMPGVMLQQSGKRGEYSIGIRGFDNRQVTVFYDGVPIYVPYDNALDLSRFLVADLESIEVSKGYASLLQGPNMMGGAVNFKSRTPKAPFEARLGFSQGMTRHKNAGYTANATLGARNDLGFIQVSGSQLTRNFVGLPAGVHDKLSPNGRRINSDTQDRRGSVKLGFTPRENDEYVFTYANQKADKNVPLYIGDNPNTLKNTKYWRWPTYNKESFYYNGTTQINEGITLLTRAYHDKFKNTLEIYNSPEDINKGNTDPTDYDDHSTGAGAQLAFDLFEADVLSFSFNWKDDVHKADEWRKGDVTQRKFKDRTFSLASEYQWAITDATDFIGGVSWDRRENKTAWTMANSDKKYDPSATKNHVNWQGVLKHRLINDDEIQFTLGERSRFASLKERYIIKPKKDVDRGEINPTLKPEKALIFELRYQGKLGQNWGYDASTYYNKVKDSINSVIYHENGKSVMQFQNIGRVDYMGLDLGINGKLNDIFSTGLSYSYIHNDVKDSDEKLSDLPKHKLAAWLKAQATESFSITLFQEARSNSYSSTEINKKTGEKIADFYAAGFGKTDLRADYDVGYGISLNASVNNLFDKTYAYSEGYIQEGRNFWFGVDYKF